MKAAETKTSSVANHQNGHVPFFGKGGDAFFSGKALQDQSAFFGSQRSAYGLSNGTAIQTKLTIGQPNDIYEKEADYMADKVVQRLSTNNTDVKNKTGNTVQTKPAAPVSTIISSLPGTIQTKCATCEQEDKLQKKEDVEEKDLMDDRLQKKSIFESNAQPPEDDKKNIQRKCAECEKEEKVQKHDDPGSSQTAKPSIESRLSSSKGSGSHLPENTRKQFESSFGADFSEVRIHDNSAAVQMSKDLNAHAFTHGNDIYFNAGKYDSKSNSGKHLLAHELTHTIQQNDSKLLRKIFNKDAEVNLKQNDSVPDTSTRFKTTFNKATGEILQKEESDDVTNEAEKLIDDNTTLFILSESGLGKDLAERLPVKATVADKVLDLLADHNRDDVSYETTIALGGKMGSVPESLRIRFIDEMVHGFVSDDEEGAISTIWISFEPNLPEVAERHDALWVKSLWESDQLDDYVKPIQEAFKNDVKGLALEYLKENKQELIVEAQRYGVDLEGMGQKIVAPPDYINAVRQVAPNILQLKNYLDDLKKIHVGYHPVSDCLFGDCRNPSTFNPDYKPSIEPDGDEDPPWPSWASVKTQYDRVTAVISAFSSLYPSIYLLIQQGKLEEFTKADDAGKAQQVINETMQKTYGKISESVDKINDESITYYDLVILQGQLFAGTAKDRYQPRYDWGKLYYTDIANDELKAHAAREFWVQLGLSLVAAAALIAAPFTAGASAAFLVGFGLGIGAGQAVLSWNKYLDLSTAADANVRDELALVSQGQVSAQLVDAIVQTVAVFLDAYGAKAATASAKASREALEGLEKGVKEKMTQELKDKMVKGAAKEGALTLGGAGVAVGLYEISDSDIPDFNAAAQEQDIDLGPDTPDTPISRKMIQRAPKGGGAGAGTGGSSTVPTSFTGPEFEMYIEKGLLQGKVGNLPPMSFVLPGQYTGSGWGIDRIGIVFDEKTGMVSVFHFEMKYVEKGSAFTPSLGSTAVGAQTGEAWTTKAVEGFLTNQNPVGRAARERLRRALQKIHPGETIDINRMRKFLEEKLITAPVHIIVPNYADLKTIYKQVAALVRWGREASVIKAVLPK